MQRTAAKRDLVGADLNDFVEALGDESLAKILLSDPFEEKIFLDMPPYGQPTRFSDGTFPVFYAAEARETSEAEIAERDAQEDPGKRLPVHMWAFHCDLNGSVVDLRPKHAEWQWLISDETLPPELPAAGQGSGRC